MKRLLLPIPALALLAVPALVACGGDDDDAPDLPSVTATTSTTSTTGGSATPGGPKLENSTVTPSGLEYRDEVVGTGDSPTMQDQVTVHYVGKIASTGEVFQDSRDFGQPVTFAMQGVIRGFSEGLATMKVGGKRTVYIPAALGYGNNPPRNSGIPPGADLIFELELLAIK
jgi:peptidylprolyl isomerase